MHSYLGYTLNRVVEREILQDNEVIKIPLFSLPDVVIFPGETIPLRIHDRRFIEEFAAREIQKMGLLYRDSKDPSSIFSVGVVVSIRALAVDEDKVIMKAIGRQRFKVLTLPTRNATSGASIYGTVQILPEFKKPPSKRKFDAISTCTNPFPAHIERSKCPYFLCKKALNLLIKCLKCDNDGENFFRVASENPLIFWYQACQELPLTEKQSIELLTAPTIIEAFHLLIKILEEKVVSNRFVCSTCYQDLAFTGDLITVAGAPGRIGAYVNPHGVVHQTITFRKLINSARIML